MCRLVIDRLVCKIAAETASCHGAGYVYFVDTNNQTVAVTLTSYLNVRGPLKDDFDNAVHMLVRVTSYRSPYQVATHL